MASGFINQADIGFAIAIGIKYHQTIAIVDCMMFVEYVSTHQQELEIEFPTTVESPIVLQIEQIAFCRYGSIVAWIVHPDSEPFFRLH